MSNKRVTMVKRKLSIEANSSPAAADGSAESSSSSGAAPNNVLRVVPTERTRCRDLLPTPPVTAPFNIAFPEDNVKETLGDQCDEPESNDQKDPLELPSPLRIGVHVVTALSEVLRRFAHALKIAPKFRTTCIREHLFAVLAVYLQKSC
ncbi:hypothetical protein MTO96_000134 [Rhipicephalus appendiculatus]